MGNWSAKRYAEAAKVDGWEKSRWDWLHIRAARLGGVTDATNLVVGTADANTHMMPFEFHIGELAKIPKRKGNTNYNHLEVTFSVDGQDQEAKHKFNEIRIKWKLVKNSGKTVEEPNGEAVFKPLNTGASTLSKGDVKVLEDFLNKQRNEVKE